MCSQPPTPQPTLRARSHGLAIMQRHKLAKTPTTKVFQATNSGLEQYMQSADTTQRGHPSTWPRLCLALDQESSGICGSGFLLRHEHLNIEQWWDWSHSCWCDIICSLKSTGSWAHTLLALVSYNVPFGPWADDMRFAQVRSSMEHLFRTEDPASCPLFVHLQKALIREGNHYDIMQHDWPQMELWRRCEQFSPWNSKGDKVVMNRFMGMRRRAKEETACWTMRSLAYQVCALECGFLKGGGFAKLVLGKNAADAAEPGGSTSSKRLQGYDKALRGACCNRLVVATLFYADPENLTRQRIFWVATEVLDNWFGEQSKSTRSTIDTRLFLTNELGGGFINMIGKLLGTCHSLEALFQVGLTIPHKILHGKPADDDLDLVQQNGWADELCSLVISLAGHRLKRMAYCTRSWPQRSAAMLKDGARGQATLDELRQDASAKRTSTCRKSRR